MAAARSPCHSTKGNAASGCARRDQSLNMLRQAQGIPVFDGGLLPRDMGWPAHCWEFLLPAKVTSQHVTSSNLRRERKLMNGRGAARWKVFVESPVSLFRVMMFAVPLGALLHIEPAL